MYPIVRGVGSRFLAFEQRSVGLVRGGRPTIHFLGRSIVVFHHAHGYPLNVPGGVQRRGLQIVHVVNAVRHHRLLFFGSSLVRHGPMRHVNGVNFTKANQANGRGIRPLQQVWGDDFNLFCLVFWAIIPTSRVFGGVLQGVFFVVIVT